METSSLFNYKANNPDIRQRTWLKTKEKNHLLIMHFLVANHQLFLVTW